MGRKPAPASSPRIPVGDFAGLQEALFVLPQPATRGWPRVLSFWKLGPHHCKPPATSACLLEAVTAVRSWRRVVMTRATQRAPGPDVCPHLIPQHPNQGLEVSQRDQETEPERPHP